MDLQEITHHYISVKKLSWFLRTADDFTVDTLRVQHNLPEIIARILALKILDPTEAPHYLNPSLRHYLPDPFHLKDMEKAVQYLAEALINKRKIVIFGDYDVDGATSSALLYRFFTALGMDVGVYIPDRIEEGYGPNIDAFSKLHHKGYEIIITVDCGITAFEALAYAKEIGLDVIVVDHHMPAGETMPEAIAVINPNRADETSEYGYLAAVGVSFLLTVALRSYLLKQNLIEPAAINLLELLDLVALGTICDMVPLIGLNRAFVVQGLKFLSQTEKIGLLSLIDVSEIKDKLNSYHLGFLLGPRVNAGGRVGKAHYGARLLSTNCPLEAADLAQHLNNYNKERKAIEENVFAEALLMAERQVEAGDLLLVLAADNWHPGVIGIVAGRIKDMFHKPVAVIAFDGDIGKASCRSVRYFDFGYHITCAKQQGILIAGGGHKMAAGFTIEKKFLSTLHTFLNLAYAEILQKCEDYGVHHFDGFLSGNAITPDLAKTLCNLGPYGPGNTEPLFMIKDCYLLNLKIAKNSHILATIGGNGGAFRAAAFRSIGTALGDNLLNSYGKNFHLIGHIKLNNWQNQERAELYIEDLILSR